MDTLILFLAIMVGLSAVAYFQLSCSRRRLREEDRVMKGFFLKGLAGLLAKVAEADGQVTGNEIELSRRYFSRMGLTEDERAVCTGYFITACKDDLTARDHARRFIAYANATACEFLYDMLWRLSRIDGRVDPSEDALLKDIADYLGIGQKVYENFKAGKKPAHDYAALKVAGVPPSLLELAR